MVGTGGKGLRSFEDTAPNSEAQVLELGVLDMNLRPDGYGWQFVTVDGQVADSGETQCAESQFDGYFSDDDGNVHEDDIDWLASIGIAKGCNPPANTAFCPEADISRGQLAAFLVRALELPGFDGDVFSDDEASVFEADINALAAAGITEGCDPPVNSSFCPDRSVTRGEMAALLVRGLDLTSSDADAFTDDDSSIFEADIDALAAAGITTGCNPPLNTSYCVDQNVLRSEMASFLARALSALS